MDSTENVARAWSEQVVRANAVLCFLKPEIQLHKMNGKLNLNRELWQ
jgi:hypothetical protein